MLQYRGKPILLRSDRASLFALLRGCDGFPAGRFSFRIPSQIDQHITQSGIDSNADFHRAVWHPRQRLRDQLTSLKGLVGWDRETGLSHLRCSFVSICSLLRRSGLGISAQQQTPN
jgi:hypothetical protein